MSNVKMETLELGCGLDPWGTVMVHTVRTWAGKPSSVTVLADAHLLPFRDKVFSMTRFWHMLEHLEDPRQAYAETLRVSLSSDVRFPTEHFLQRAFQAIDLSRIRNHNKKVKREAQKHSA